MMMVKICRCGLSTTRRATTTIENENENTMMHDIMHLRGTHSLQNQLASSALATTAAAAHVCGEKP
jgi:UDP-N-acetylmuramoylalanine-D-glutamate ligase